MSDAYGTIVVGFSDDFKGDKKALVEALNLYCFTSDSSEFESDGEKIWLNNRCAQYPTVYAEKELAEVYIEDSDKTIFMNARDVTQEYEVEDTTIEQVELAELAEQLAKHIEFGSMYLTASSTEKCVALTYSNLRVHWDGSAERSAHLVYIGRPPRVYNEEVKAA